MDTSIAQQIQNLLQKHDKIGVVVGKNPTMDEMGAALALYLTLTAHNKTVSVAAPTEPTVEISSLVGIDKVRSELLGDGGDLIVSFPYREGEIEKVSYTLEDGFLNIVVKAGGEGLSFSEKEVRYKRAGGLPTLLFIIGTPRLSDLGNLFDPDALKNTTVVNIDNKDSNQGFGDVVFVSPKFSSISEQMTSILSVLDNAMDVDIAQNLLSGIIFATDNFQHPKTSSQAFEMAALLMKKGAQRKVVQRESIPDAFFAKPQQGFEESRRVGMGGSQDTTRFDFGQAMPRSEQKQSQKREPFPKQQQQIRSFQQHQQRPQQAQKQPVHQSQPQSQQQPLGVPQWQQGTSEKKEDKKEEQETPPDWLTPKVYKSSTLI